MTVTDSFPSVPSRSFNGRHLICISQDPSSTAWPHSDSHDSKENTRVTGILLLDAKVILSSSTSTRVIFVWYHFNKGLSRSTTWYTIVLKTAEMKFGLTFTDKSASTNGAGPGTVEFVRSDSDPQCTTCTTCAWMWTRDTRWRGTSHFPWMRLTLFIFRQPYKNESWALDDCHRFFSLCTIQVFQWQPHYTYITKPLFHSLTSQR